MRSGFGIMAGLICGITPKCTSGIFLEANANAGFDPNPRDAMTASIKAHGMTLDDFVLQIVHNSLN